MKTISSNCEKFDLSILNVKSISINAQGIHALHYLSVASKSALFCGVSCPEATLCPQRQYPALMNYSTYQEAETNPHGGGGVCYSVRPVTNLMVSKYTVNHTFGHLLKRAGTETCLQPASLRRQGVAIISIPLTKIWCAHLGTDPGCKSRFMHVQML